MTDQATPAANPDGGPVVAPDFELLYQQAPCGYLVTADDGSITAVNDTFLTWTGYTRAQLLDTPVQKLMPVGDRMLYSTHSRPQLLVTGAVAEVAIEIVDAAGARRAALLSASRTPATDQEPAIVRVIVFSAHERRKYEKELVAALRQAEESEARRAAAEADLQFRASHDALTGLPNRAGLLTGLAAALTENATHRSGLGLLFIDLDHFKAVNDSLGHAAGDELLIIVAQRLRAAVREGGTIARLSGDEFVVVDQLADTEDAAALANRLLEALAVPVVLDGLEVVVSASIGAAVAEPADDTPDRLLRRADIAMYQAKGASRNSFQVHDPTQTDPAVDRLRLLGELRHGIENGQLRLHYQPRVDLRTGRPLGVEALVRWQHPTRGLLTPVAFIDLAEESGLVRELGAWVLDHAIAQVAAWQRLTPKAPLEMAVNLSVRQLADRRLVGLVAHALTTHGLPAELLTLEITETALMGDPQAALDTLQNLKALGVSLAVDDFGTGYSSLTYLKRFPIDELKIDQSFVRGLGTDGGDEAIVTSCVQLAHALGLRAVAEGVETDAQRVALLNLACDSVQGYLFSRPLPPENLWAWITTHPTAHTKQSTVQA